MMMMMMIMTATVMFVMIYNIKGVLQKAPQPSNNNLEVSGRGQKTK